MKKLLLTVTTSLALLFSFLVLPVVAASVPGAVDDSKSTACQALGADVACNASPGSKGVEDIVRVALNILSLVVGAASVIMIILGGLKYITSAGDSNGVASAKNTLIYAIVGLVIVLLSQSIVRFVFAKTSNCTPDKARNITC